MSYKKLEIWQLAREVVVEIHEMTVHELPKFEMYEVGSQIRRSIKSVKSNIVEGYGRKYYKQEFIRFLIFALASNNETIDHLETLFETGSLKNEKRYKDLQIKLDKLGRKINSFIQAVQKGHKSEKLRTQKETKTNHHQESNIEYPISTIQYPTSNIKHPISNI